MSHSIDKTNLVELSEAINSMYRWYANAVICYVYLTDVPSSGKAFENPEGVSEGTWFSHSRWFTRGWTLQELIAPKIVEFYASDWSEIGTKLSLKSAIHDITQIKQDVLTKSVRLADCSVGERMSWAARRETTRDEDIAYCLLGIFDVNIPLIYGEGLKAFRRLQEEIMRTTEDHTLLIWGLFSAPLNYASALAVHPNMFRNSKHKQDRYENVLPIRLDFNVAPTVMTSRGVQLSVPIIVKDSVTYLVLNCDCVQDGKRRAVAIEIVPWQSEPNCYSRRRSGIFYRGYRLVDCRKRQESKRVSVVYLATKPDRDPSSSRVLLPLSKKTIISSLDLTQLDNRWQILSPSSLGESGWKLNSAVSKEWRPRRNIQTSNTDNSAIGVFERYGPSDENFLWTRAHALPTGWARIEADRIRSSSIHIVFFVAGRLSFIVAYADDWCSIMQPLDLHPSERDKAHRAAYAESSKPSRDLVSNVSPVWLHNTALIDMLVPRIDRVDRTTDRCSVIIDNYEVSSAVKREATGICLVVSSRPHEGPAGPPSSPVSDSDPMKRSSGYTSSEDRNE